MPSAAAERQAELESQHAAAEGIAEAEKAKSDELEKHNTTLMEEVKKLEADAKLSRESNTQLQAAMESLRASAEGDTSRLEDELKTLRIAHEEERQELEAEVRRTSELQAELDAVRASS